MTTKEFQNKRPLVIFLSYFKRHWKLFAVDISCAVLISAVDLAFPLVTRTALYEMLPNEAYTTFFVVMGIMLVAYALRSVVASSWPSSVIPSAFGWRRISGRICSGRCRP